MPKYAIFNSVSGQITRIVNVPSDIINAQLLEGEDFIESDADVFDSIDPITKEVLKGMEPKLQHTDPDKDLDPYVRNRKKLYPKVTEQLDLLFKDIEAGTFGEGAKNSEWFKRIKLIKASVPKNSDNSAVIYHSGEVL